jgi:hypothetical protein
VGEHRLRLARGRHGREVQVRLSPSFNSRRAADMFGPAFILATRE